MSHKTRFLTADFVVATAQHFFAAAVSRARSLSPDARIRNGQPTRGRIMKPSSNHGIRRSSAIVFASILLSMWILPVSAAGNQCAGAIARMTLPAGWIAANKDGLVSFKSPSRTESVTIGVYAVQAPFASETGRSEVMTKLAELRRGFEHQLSGGDLVLSEVTRDQAGGLLRMRYSGKNPRAGRSFAHWVVSSPRCLQSVYYEAAGLPPRKFERTARMMFRSLEILDAGSPDTGPGSGAAAAQDLDRHFEAAQQAMGNRPAPSVSPPLPFVPIVFTPPQ